ncbi:MAG: hypothetical protein KDD22_00970, partial [Bdellovibrionales bacterium]|nr:hypothetical protein [Bdellovibrionales bacterium]
HALKTPIISGNVSLYNETLNKNVTSTPSTGWVGLRPSLDKIPSETFVKEGSDLWCVSLRQLESNGYWAEKAGEPLEYQGRIDSSKTAQFVQNLISLGRHTEVLAAKRVGKFGMPYALARMSLGGIGAEITNTSLAGVFRERLYEVIIEVSAGSDILTTWLESLKLEGLQVEKLGKTQKDRLQIRDWNWKISDLGNAYRSGWKGAFEELA